MNEKTALKISILGCVFMGGLGISFALLTNSDAILLDGMFNLIAFGLGIITLKIFLRLEKGETERFQFGYYAFEPFINIIKSLSVLGVSIMALVISVEKLFLGGSELALGYAIVYSVIATSGCIVIMIGLRHISKRIKSPLVEVDAKNWTVSCMLSGAILAAFVISFVLSENGWGDAALYVDPIMVIGLVIVVISIPIKILRQNLLQMLLSSPPEDIVKDIRNKIEGCISSLNPTKVKIRVAQQGRLTYVMTHVTLPKDSPHYSVEELDNIRDKVSETTDDENISVDIVFSKDEKWT